MNYHDADTRQNALQDLPGFWAKEAQNLRWQKPFTTILNGKMALGNVTWFEDGCLNVTENCLDRHLEMLGHKTAILFEGNEPDRIERISYQTLYEKVCQFANLLKSRGIKKGDRVCIYMPTIPEAAYAMLACARIGAVHTVVFGGFSAESLQQRILDADARLVVTVNGGFRGAKPIHFKATVDAALQHCPNVHTVIVVSHLQLKTPVLPGRDLDYHEAMQGMPTHCPAEIMNAEDPLFILYTSGSTGQPKGIVHTTAGYLLYASFTHRTVFDLRHDDIYWCTADIGWITGHSYVVYGPLANGATTLMFEGIPEYPTHSRYWEIIDRHKVSIFYTSPTAIRALMRHGDEPLKHVKLDTLRLLGCVGEPINPEPWRWYHQKIGHDRCPIMDTWWQTETGGIMIAPPLSLDQVPGSVMQPWIGIEANILGHDHRPLLGEGEGDLVISQPWPGMARGIHGNSQRFLNAYFNPHPGHYTTGDGAKRDKNGYLWITGRQDDVLNVSGHRLGSAEIENALLQHAAVAEAAVVGLPHDIKGEGIYAYISLKDGHLPSPEMRADLIKTVRQHIGPIATPDFIQFAPQLPKTRSGKIMRRILRLIARGQFNDLGDTSTLANPNSLEDLIKHCKASTEHE